MYRYMCRASQSDGYGMAGNFLFVNAGEGLRQGHGKPTQASSAGGAQYFLEQGNRKGDVEREAQTVGNYG
jgi:hypothetical protein